MGEETDVEGSAERFYYVIVTEICDLAATAFTVIHQIDRNKYVMEIEGKEKEQMNKANRTTLRSQRSAVGVWRLEAAVVAAVAAAVVVMVVEEETWAVVVVSLGTILCLQRV